MTTFDRLVDIAAETDAAAIGRGGGLSSCPAVDAAQRLGDLDGGA
jgi:hypothetical protein